MSDAHRDEIAKLEALYAQNPGGRVFTHLAEAYRKAGELERARDVLADGLQNHPDYSSAHVVLGRVLHGMGRTDEAAAEFRRVLELDSHNLIALRALGDLARDRGDHEEALAYYRDLVELEPSEELRGEIERLSGAAGAGVAEEPEEPAPPAYEPGGHEYAGEPAGDALEGTGDEVAVGADEEAAVGADESEHAGGEPEHAEATGYEPAAGHDAGATGYEPPAEDLEEEEPVFTGYGADPSGVTTETIAQVYARQGLYDRAADVYRELLRSRPDDEGLQERLREMQQLASAQEEGGAETPALSEPEPGTEADPYAPVEPVSGADVEVESWGGEVEEHEDAEPAEVAGFEPGEAVLEADIEPLPGLESEELDPGTLAEATPEETGTEAYDVSGEPEFSAEELAGAGSGPWITGDGEEAASAPEAGTPIRDYLGGVLEWGAGQEPDAAEPEAAEPVAGPAEPEPEVESGFGAGSQGDAAAEGPAADPSAEDDDLEMFRSWLESLKQ